MRRKRRQGRPLTFKRPQRRQLAELIRQHGVRGAQEVAPIAISAATLLTIAREFGIALKKGRRPRQQNRIVANEIPSTDLFEPDQVPPIDLDLNADRKAA